MLEWAQEHAVLGEFVQVINCTGLTYHPHALGRVLVALDSGVARELLDKWSQENECAQTLRRIATARQIPDPRILAYRPLPDVVPATAHITKNIATYYLTALLVARLPAVGPNHRAWFERLRLWLFVHCLERANLGNLQDKHLEIVCSKLRLAHDGSDGWLNLFEQLRTDSLGFEAIGVHLAAVARRMLDSPPGKPRLAHIQQSLLESLASASRHEHDPNSGGNYFPSRIGEPVWSWGRGIWDEYSIALSETETPEREESSPSALIPAAIGSSDLRKISVDEKASYTHQRLQANSVLLAAAEDLHFLPWSWNRPNPIELPLLATWIQNGLDSRDTARKAVAIFSVIALITGRSLRRALDIHLGATASQEWILDLSRKRLLRIPPRRIPGWTPESPNDREWVALTADISYLDLPDTAADFISDLVTVAPNPKCLGDLWNSDWGDTPEAAFLRFAKTELPRLSPSMLGNVLPQQAFLKNGDGVFARLLCSHPKTGLPGATAYSSWKDYQVDEATVNVVATLGFPKQVAAPTGEPLNALGSQLDVLEGLLKAAIEKLNLKIEEIRRGSSLVDFHNALTAQFLLKLYAATGGRPLRDPFCSPLYFGFEDGTLYIDDKHTQKARTGRLIVLPRILAREVAQCYLNHLAHMAEALDAGAPDLSAAIRMLSLGKESKRLPFFFFLDVQSGQINWRHASEKHLRELDLFECPLPLNLFRHRLAIRLRHCGVDPELIDAVLGHAESGAATHGDHSFRVWQEDMSGLQNTFEACFDALGFAETTTLPTSQGKLFLKEVVSASVRDFGAKARAKARRERTRGAIASARGIITAHQKGRQLDELTKDELEALSRALLTNETGLPHPLGALRFSVLVSAANQLNQEEGKKVRFSHRYRQLEDETSPFAPDGPGAVVLLARVRAEVKRLVPELTKIRLGKTDATVVAVVLLMALSRIADRQLIRDVMTGKNIRLIRARPGFYLEHGKNLDVNDPAAPVHRHRISNSAARLINMVLDRSYQRSLENQPIPAPLRRIAECLIDDGRLRQDPEVSHLFAALVDIVDQANIRSFPGVVAGYLGGRITSASLEWRDWMTLRWNQRIVVESSPKNTTDSVPDNDLPASSPDTQDVEALQKEARSLFSNLRADLNPGCEESSLTPNARRDIKAAMRKTLSDKDGKAPRPCLLLGAWVADLLERKSGHDGFLARGAIKRYFSALSPAFAAVGYAVDLELADEDEITEFYTEVLDARELQNQDYVFARLKEFHRWLSVQIDIEDPVWAELPCNDGSVPVDPGIVIESDYLRAFNGMARESSNKEQSKYAAFLLLGAYRFGMRSGEVLGLLRSDWISIGQHHVVIVQNNRHRKLKRKASRRAVPLLASLTAGESALIEWVKAAAEARSGDDKQALLFSSADRKTHHQLRRMALATLKLATGNPDSNLHRLRHSAANQVMCGLSGIDLPSWTRISKIGKIHKSSVQLLLLGREGSTRRAVWAGARYLGHAGPRAAFQSYYHFISDLVEQCIALPDEKQRHYEHAIDLGKFPLVTFEKELPLPTTPAPIYGKTERVIKSLRLLARGKKPEEIADWMGWQEDEFTQLVDAIAEINSRMNWQERGDGKKPDVRLEWLTRIRNDGWNRMLSRARKIDAEFGQHQSLQTSLMCVQKMVGSSRQLLAWKTEHFQVLSRLRDLWEIPQGQFAFLMAGQNERMASSASSYGFDPGDPKKHGQRIEGHQIDVAFDDDEKILRVAIRCALCLNESDDAVIRNRFELIVAMLSIVNFSDHVNAEKERLGTEKA